MQIRRPVLDIPLCQSGNRLSALREECNNKEENKNSAKKRAIETLTAEEELDICSSRRRNGGIHERAPSELLIAESSNSPRLATLHYSHFIQQLLLPPPITNTHTHAHTHTHTHTHAHTHTHSQERHSAYHRLHDTTTCRITA